MPRTCHRDCLWISELFLIRYIALKTFWNDLKPYNVIKINVEEEITTTGLGLHLEGKTTSTQSLALFNFKCGSRPLFFKRNFKRQVFQSPWVIALYSVEIVFATYFLAWEFILQSQWLLPSQCPHILAILRSVPVLKPAGNAPWTWIWMWRQYCVDFCCLSSYLELQIFIYKLTVIGGHCHIHKFISFFVYFLLLFSRYVQLFCDLMDCSPRSSSVHGTSRARILEGVVISFSGGILLTQGSNPCLLLVRLILYHWATWGAYSFCMTAKYSLGLPRTNRFYSVQV